MDDSELQSTIPPLLASCYKIIKIFGLLREHLKPVPLTMASITNECFTVRASLATMQNLDISQITSQTDQNREEGVKSIDALFIGCGMTLNVTEEYVEAFLREVQIVFADLDTPEEAEAERPAKIRELWNEIEMKELLTQLRGYRNGLTELIAYAPQKRTENEQTSVTELPTDTTTSLEEISLPPQARPISMLSWEQGSFVEPAPPYAVSLHEYTRGYSVEPSKFTTQQTFSKNPKVRLFDGVREYKLVVAGADGIGKSAIVSQFITGTMKDNYVLLPNTNDHKICVIDGETVIGHVLDTTRQEEYTMMPEQDVRTGEAFLLVYSIKSRGTFTGITILHQQIKKVKGRAHCPLVLLGNHSDQHREREVSTQEAEALAKSLGCDFYEVSSQQHDRISAAFDALIKDIRTHDLHIKQQIARAKATSARVRNMYPEPSYTYDTPGIGVKPYLFRRSPSLRYPLGYNFPPGG